MKIKLNTYFLATIAIAFSLLFTSCSAPSIPEYSKFKITKIKRIDKKWQISGNATFMNKNSFGGNVKACDIDVYIDDVLASHISQTVKVNIDAEKEFSVPVVCTIDSKKIRKENKGFLKKVVKGLLGEKVDLRYDGNFVVDLMGTSVKIPFEYEEKVGFGVNYE